MNKYIFVTQKNQLILDLSIQHLFLRSEAICLFVNIQNPNLTTTNSLELYIQKQIKIILLQSNHIIPIFLIMTQTTLEHHALLRRLNEKYQNGKLYNNKNYFKLW